MKVQKIITSRGPRYILLDDNYCLVEEANRFLRMRDACGVASNTLKANATSLKFFYEYMQKRGVPIKNLACSEVAGPVDLISDFMIWYQYPNYSNNIYLLDGEKPARDDNTTNNTVSIILSFYRYMATNKEIQLLDFYREQMFSKPFIPFLYELIRNKSKLMTNIFRKRVPKNMSSQIVSLNHDQYQEMLKYCRLKRDKLLLGILHETGIRLNEALGIHISDLNDIEKGIIHIVYRCNNQNESYVKEKAERDVYIPRYLSSLLIEYLIEIDKYDSDYLFIVLNGPTTGQPYSAGTAEKLFERLAKRVGYKTRPHMFRHGFAVERLESGKWEMEDIQAAMGHKYIQSTLIYAHFSKNKKT